MQWCRPRTVRGGCVVEKKWTTPLTTSVYDSNVLVRPMYVKLLTEGEGKYGVVQPKENMLHSIFFLLIERIFPFLSFGKCVAMNLSSLKDVLRTGAKPPKSLMILKWGSAPLHDTPAFMASF